jgi:hypothetical protein
MLASVTISAGLALVCAILNSGILGGFPPKLRLHNLQIAAATSHVYVDLPDPTPSLVHRRATPPEDLQTMVKRAELLGRIMVTPPVLDPTAARCGIGPRQLSGLGRTTAGVPSALTEPDSERRASDIKDSEAPYRLEVQARPTVPYIDVYAQAPTVAQATCLANAAPVALSQYLRGLAHAEGSTDPVMRITGGAARGAVVNGGATATIALLTFVTVFGLAYALLVALARLIAWRHRRPPGAAAASDDEDDDALAPLTPDPHEGLDAWPHTSRLLPWTLAGFIALLWLTPFNNIELNASLPVELRLDRLVLPFLLLVWVLAFASGGRLAPRLRMTWIHVALGGLLACAFLSVVTDARYLNHSLELDLSLKKLPLIVSYVSLFVIAASAVRRAEVRPFLTLTLGLSVICALGMIWEYRMHQNLFWEWSAKLLPSGLFEVNGALPGGAVDHIGRPVVRGPAEVPLEAVAMLTMAMPIALVRILQSSRWRDRIVYGLIITLLVAATLATYRKSALIAPVSVVLTLAYFRRRELLRLAPLGMVLLAVVSFLSPGALSSTVSQFTRSDAAAVPTVSDRASDYDAVRPDVWSHLLLGRGWGSYNHDSYRILDSEILSRAIEIGVIGLGAFLLVGVSVVAVSRRTIASRDPTAAPVALIGASIAVAFLVIAFLYDTLSFPHPMYIFLYMVGFVTVMLQAHGSRRRRPPPQERPTRPLPVADDALPDDPDPRSATGAQVPVAPMR